MMSRKRMVAEGVEDSVAYTELTRYGCDQVQGFYVCRPIPAAELDRWLDGRLGVPIPRPAAAHDLARDR